jgi:4'-phosphopantetheinyl transferase
MWKTAAPGMRTRFRLLLRRFPVMLACLMLRNEKLWSCAPTASGLLPGEVEVWAAWLDLNAEEAAALWTILSREEQERARRFASERDRGRFAAARGLLRTILGNRLSIEPRGIEFGYSANGKPFLMGGFAGTGLQFNLSHSGGLAVFALGRRGLVGVDVEQVRPVPNLSPLAERFFSAREYAEIQRLSGEEAQRGFFRIWTRKEAWLKATGQGITGPLKSVEVLGSSGDVEVRAEPRDGTGEQRLRLYDLAPAPGFVGALAVSSQ